MVLSDLDIARSITLKPIRQVAEGLGVLDDEFDSLRRHRPTAQHVREEGPDVSHLLGSAEGNQENGAIRLRHWGQTTSAACAIAASVYGTGN